MPCAAVLLCADVGLQDKILPVLIVELYVIRAFTQTHMYGSIRAQGSLPHIRSVLRHNSMVCSVQNLLLLAVHHGDGAAQLCLVGHIEHKSHTFCGQQLLMLVQQSGKLLWLLELNMQRLLSCMYTRFSRDLDLLAASEPLINAYIRKRGFNSALWFNPGQHIIPYFGHQGFFCNIVCKFGTLRVHLMEAYASA